jgi:AcrR family transcriptional regulator
MQGVNPIRSRRGTLREERAAATRRRIEDAARRLFIGKGYAATTIADIAGEAGVAVQTVYAVHASKAGVLAALRQRAVEQPEAEASYRSAMAEPDPARRLLRFATSIRQRWQATGDVVAIHNDAGNADPGVRAGVEDSLRRRRGGLTALAGALAPALRPGLELDDAAAILDALTMPEIYLELTGAHDWTPDAYEAWLGRALVRELLGEH